MRLKESTIPSELKASLATNCIIDWEPLDTEPIYLCLFTAIAKYLGINKSVDAGKVALRFDDYKGNMMMAAIVTYTPNEDPAMPGNWSLEFTFDPDDVKGINPVHGSNDMSFHMVMADVTLKIMASKFKNITMEDGIIKNAVETLVACLDRNATPEAAYEIEVPDYFTASVVVDTDGHKHMAIEPSAKLSRIVKGDADIEA